MFSVVFVCVSVKCDASKTQVSKDDQCGTTSLFYSIVQFVLVAAAAVVVPYVDVDIDVEM